MRSDDRAAAIMAIKTIAERTSMKPRKIVVYVVLGGREPVSLEIRGELEGKDETTHESYHRWGSRRLPYCAELEAIISICGLNGFDARLVHTPHNGLVLLERFRRPPLPIMEPLDYHAEVLAINPLASAAMTSFDPIPSSSLVLRIARDLRVGECLPIIGIEPTNEHQRSVLARYSNMILAFTNELDYPYTDEIIIVERCAEWALLSVRKREQQRPLLVVGLDYSYTPLLR
jgi:hypothetical protein